ncbi:hypothetical protein Bca4012_062249 [Brassica carinata]
MRYVIGNGELINMWTDPWIPDHPPRPPRPRNQNPDMCKVKHFFLQDRSYWDEAKLRELVMEEDVEKILSIKISSKARQDLMGWHYNENGIYSVKSDIGLAPPTRTCSDPRYPGSIELKQRLWKMKSPRN